MSNAGKVSAWVGGSTAVAVAVVTVLMYGGSVMSSEIEHESRHTKVETTVIRIEKSAEEHWKVIESQLQAGQERDILIMLWLKEQ